MIICGPKLSLCGVIVSVWGVIQLALMGIFYKIEAVALAEDLPPPTDDNFTTTDQFYNHITMGYIQNAYNCWIAALLYLATLAFSAYQFWENNRSSLNV